MFIDIYADWCAACRLLERGALANDEVVHLLARFVTIRLDVSTPSVQTDAVSERFGARVLPTLCLISPDGELTRLEGTISPAELAAALRKVGVSDDRRGHR